MKDPLSAIAGILMGACIALFIGAYLVWKGVL